MSQNLLLIESPGKIKTYKKILGSDWQVLASMGHIRELAKDGTDNLGFDIQDSAVVCRYVERNPKAKQTISQLKQAVKQARRVILATDGDREGEFISWHLQQVLKLKNPERIVVTEIVPAAVRAALSNPRRIDANLVGAAQARACLDKLVGFQGSPLLWQLDIGAKSIGRVQTAALHLLCQREREIQTFRPVDYWSVWVDYQEGFRAFYYIPHAPKTGANSRSQVEVDSGTETDEAAEKSANPTESSRVTSQAEAERLVQIAQTRPHQVLGIQQKTAHKSPPPPFVTSTLQQAAGAQLKFSPEKTMQLAQKLYEAGLITYMRTDSIALSEEFCQSVRKWLQERDPQNLPEQATRHRSAKNAQEAHEAIRPTDVFLPSADLRASLESESFSLYVMIWKRAVASLCRPARLCKTQVITQSGDIQWQARGQVLEFAGYTRYWKDISDDTLLPVLNQGQRLTLKQAGSEKKQTQPPPRYTEPKLVQAMERSGIGRPSTYAPTVRTLKERGYVELKQRKLQVTPLGLQVDEFVAQTFPEIAGTELTAQMEAVLDDIAEGQKDWQGYVSEWNRSYWEPALHQARQKLPLRSSAATISPSAPSSASPKRDCAPRTGKANRPRGSVGDRSEVLCPQCQEPLSIIQSRSKKLAKPYFLKCEAGCEDVVLFYNKASGKWVQGGKERTKTETVSSKSEYLCPVCGKLLEEYQYQKEGQAKKMLRCSDPTARQQKNHKDAVYFWSRERWWSAKYGELRTC